MPVNYDKLFALQVMAINLWCDSMQDKLLN